METLPHLSQAILMGQLLLLLAPLVNAAPSDASLTSRADSLLQDHQPFFWVAAAIILILTVLVILLGLGIIRRRQIESALAKSEENFRTLVENAPEAMYIQTNHRFVYVNAAAVRLLGAASAEELLGTSTLERIDPTFHRRVLDRVAHLTVEGKAVDFLEEVYLKLDGTPIDVEVSAVPFRYQEENGVLVVFRDISRRKRAEEALRESEGKFRDLVEKAVAGVYVIQDGVFRYVNSRFAGFFGYTVSEMTDSVTAEEVVFQEDWPAMAESIRKRLTGEMPSLHAGLRIVTKSGEVRHIEIYSSRTLLQGRPAIIGTAVDVTERKIAEEQLKASESMLRSVFHAAPIGITFAIDRVLVAVNEAACDLTGYSRDELVGKDARCFYLSDSEYESAGRELYSQVLRTGRGSTEARFLKKDGTLMDVILTGGMLRAEDPAAGFVVTIQDITERKRTQEALEKHLVALTRPLTETGDVAFEDLFNLADLQRLQDRFAEACGVGSLIARPDGAPITRKSNFSILCSEIIHKIPKGLRNCKYSDFMLGRFSGSEPIIRPCPHIGLLTAAASITVAGRHVANWLVGQVRDAAQGQADVVGYAREIGADEAAFEAAYRQIPVMSRERFEQIANALYVLANQLSTIAFQNIQQARFINERKLAEESVRQNEALLRSLLEATPVGVALLAHRVFQKVNAALCNITGYSEEEMIGMETRFLYPDEDTYVRVGVELYERMATTGVGVMESQLRRKDGELIEVLLCLSPFDPADAAKGVTATVLDITERKRIADELRHTSTLLDEIIENIPNMIFLKDAKDLRFVRLNRAGEDLIGYSRNELLGKDDYDLFPKEQADFFTTKDREVLDRKEIVDIPEEFLETRAMGRRVLHTKKVPLLDANGQLAYLLGISEDITERKEAELELLREKEFAEKLLESLPGIFFLYDSTCHLKRWNKAHETAIGFTAEELRDWYIPDWHETPEEAAAGMAFVKSVLETGVGGAFETTLINKAGRFVPYLISITRLMTPDGPVMMGVGIDITERKQAEEALKSAKKWFEDVLELMPDAILITDKDYKVIAWNRAIERMTGIPKADVLGFDHHAITVGFYGEVRKSLIDLVFVDDSELASKYSNVRRVGSTLYAEAYAPAVYNNRGAYIFAAVSPFYDEEGSFVGIIESIRDVTEQKRAEEALRESEERFRRITENMSDMVCELDGNGIYRYATPSYVRNLGYTPQSLIGESAFDLVHPDDRDRVTAVFMDLVRSRRDREVELRFQLANGSYVWLRSSGYPVFSDDDEFLGVIVNSSDITERKRAEEEARRLRNYLSNIINSMPSVLVGVDTNGCVTHWNKAAEKKTGVGSDDAKGRRLDEVLPSMSHQLDQLRQAMRMRAVSTHPRMISVLDGEQRYEDVTVYPLVTNGVEGAVIRVDDVTERVRIEEMMVQSEKMLSVGGLAAGMAHEINNPLGVILQATQNIIRRVSPDLPINVRVADECGISVSGLRHYLERREILTFLRDILESGQRAAEIVANMLSFSRKAEGAVTPTDLGELLDRTVSLAASDYDLKKHYDFRQIEIVREYQPDTPRVICQAGKIQQVFLNILRNGAEAMMAAKDQERLPCFHLRVGKEEGAVRVEIEDNGPGLDEATRKRVFEPFFTTKPPGAGTGLGLSVSYFIVTEEHGGSVTVESSPGAGTRFVIRLPIEGKSSGPVPNNEDSPSPDAGL